jgi:hypothetical protein
LTVTLKYKTDQTNIVVEPLREMHGMVKSAVITEFVRILPNTTKSIIKKLCKGNSAFPKNYSELVAVDRTAEDVEQFENMARERLEDVRLCSKNPLHNSVLLRTDDINGTVLLPWPYKRLMTFGGSEESHDSDSGKSKMVSFSPPKAGRDGGADFDKAWTINANASIKSDMARRIQLKPLCFTAPG